MAQGSAPTAAFVAAASPDPVVFRHTLLGSKLANAAAGSVPNVPNFEDVQLRQCESDPKCPLHHDEHSPERPRIVAAFWNVRLRAGIQGRGARRVASVCPARETRVDRIIASTSWRICVDPPVVCG
jgi:hypothetical protein